MAQYERGYALCIKDESPITEEPVGTVTKKG